MKGETKMKKLELLFENRYLPSPEEHRRQVDMKIKELENSYANSEKSLQIIHKFIDLTNRYYGYIFPIALPYDLLIEMAIRAVEANAKEYKKTDSEWTYNYWTEEDFADLDIILANHFTDDDGDKILNEIAEMLTFYKVCYEDKGCKMQQEEFDEIIITTLERHIREQKQ